MSPSLNGAASHDPHPSQDDYLSANNSPQSRPIPLHLHDLQERRRRHSNDSDDDDRRSHTSRASAMSISIPRGPSHQETALAALQYLPMPVLLLSAFKTVVLANEAMARLLCSVSLGDDSKKCGGSAAVTNSLIGQTLSQIGIDMLQPDGTPLWIDWENFLDSIGDRDDDGTKEDKESRGSNEDTNITSGASTPTVTGDSPQELSASNLNRTVVHDVAVDVVISPVRCVALRSSQAQAVSEQIIANMIISAWHADDSKFFTLTFTSPTTKSSSHSKVSQSDKSQATSRTVSKSSRTYTSSPKSTSSSSSSGHHSHRSSMPPSYPTSNLSSPGFSPSFPPGGPPSRANLSSAPSVLQKATKLRDALLNAMNLPCYAMWEDFSIGIPNAALMRLAPAAASESRETEEFLLHFDAWTEDFTRRLSTDEYPIAQLIRGRQRVRSKIGLKDPITGQPRVYDTSGDVLLDDNGEFYGGFVSDPRQCLPSSQPCFRDYRVCHEAIPTTLVKTANTQIR